MRRSIKFTLLMCFLCFVSILLFTACNDAPADNELQSTPAQTTPVQTTPAPHIHTEVIIPAVEATCTQTGLSEGKECSECGDILIAQQETPLAAHTEVIIPATEATCTNSGLTEGKSCSVCLEIIIEQQATSIDHIAGEWILDKAATKNEDGQRHTECVMCHEVMSEEVIPATGSVGLAYLLNSTKKTCQITGIGSSTDSEVVIPAYIEGYKVTSISGRAFDDCTNITSITIPDTVTTIGERAFDGCTGITEIIIPNSVTSMGAYNFSDCTSLVSVVIGNGITDIQERTFYGCTSLANVTIGKSVTIIGQYAFGHCPSLTSIMFPESITQISNGAFSSLSNIHITNLEAWCKVSCSSRLGSAIKTYLNNELITDLVIPDGITSISSGTFAGCTSFTSIVIPESVTRIEGAAFSGCTSLTSIVIPESVTRIDGAAFSGCTSLTSIVIPDTVKSSLSSTFKDCTALTSAVIGNGVTAIGNDVFYGCTSLKNVVIGNSVTRIGNYAFIYCDSLENIYISDIEQWCSISFTSNPLQIKQVKLYLNNELVTNLVIPNGVTKISEKAFIGYHFLTSVTIPESITSIGNSAFAGCYKLIEVYNFSSLTITKGDSTNGSIGYYALDIYTSQDEASKLWTDDNGYIFYEDSDTCYLMGYTGTENELTLPESCNGKEYEIYYYAFYNNISLKSVKIPENVVRIWDEAFYKCNNLTSVVFENTTGWWRRSSPTDASAFPLSTTDLEDPAIAAEYLTSTYSYMYWFR